MYELYERAKSEYGYNATRFLRKLRADGGLAAARMVLRRRGSGDSPPKGLIAMVDRGGVELTVEATVLQRPWGQLFTKEGREIARCRLARYGYVPSQTPRQRVPLTIDEVPNDPTFPEGSKKTVTINQYERNPKARSACIRNFGAVCYVCGFNFGKTYGHIAEGFIHVHHLSALSAVGEEYQVNPITDLRPVCPNCHAVIHMQDPPYSIEQVKMMLRNEKSKSPNS
jgi:predicted HNH restriction endonuclease